MLYMVPGITVHCHTGPDSWRWHWQNRQNHPCRVSISGVKPHHTALIITDAPHDLIRPLCCQLLQSCIHGTLCFCVMVRTALSLMANYAAVTDQSALPTLRTCLRSVMLSATCSSSSFGFGNSIITRKPSSLHTTCSGPHMLSTWHAVGAVLLHVPCRQDRAFLLVCHDHLYFGCGAPLDSSFETP